MDNYRPALRRHRTTDFDLGLARLDDEERYSRGRSRMLGDSQSLWTPYERDHFSHSVRPTRRPSPSVRQRSRYNSLNLRINADKYTNKAATVRDAAIKAEIYYIPKMIEAPPIHATDNEGNTIDNVAEAKAMDAPDDGSFTAQSPRSLGNKFVMYNKSSIDSPKSKKSRSSSNFGPDLSTKDFVLPILMWPTGLPEDNGTDQWHAAQSHYSLGGNEKAHQRTRNPVGNSSQSTANDSSLNEVLERIYNSLLTDRSSNHDAIFRDMEEARRKDAIYKVPENRDAATKPEDTTGDVKSDPENDFLQQAQQMT